MRREGGAGLGSRLARGAARVLLGVVLLALPFWLLIRADIWLELSHGWPAPLALAAAGSLALGALAGAVLAVALRIPWPSVRRAVFRAGFVGLGLALAVVAGQALLSLPAHSAKTEAERADYRDLHPALRLAVGSLRVLDEDLVLTDIGREPADYARMGLAVPAWPRHGVHTDGTWRAVDMRTRGQGGLRNLLVQGWFESLGFHTLRHGGTGDHLHVELRDPRAAP